ncbi:permease [Citrobacter freundii]|uniref:permease n=1 Tax=Citrobacter freundii TaxID=546 RepID=UPI0017ADF13D|nr:permease [Salmonella enterica]
MSRPAIRLQDSIVAGLINGVINGLIAHWHFKDVETVPLSVDAIAHEQTSVWGEAVSLTFGLGIILSLITARLFVKHLHKAFPTLQSSFNPSFFRTMLPIAVTQCAALFGWFVVLAVIWTKYMGSQVIPSFWAAFMVGGFAFAITLIIEYRTKQSLISKKVSLLD